jgi:hypothetical protein
MLTKLAEIYNRQDIVDDHKSYQARIIKRRSYIIKRINSISYIIDNKIHRDNDKPSVEYEDGTKYWYKNGKRHRDNDKPSVEDVNGTKEWYQNGVFIRSS